MHLKSVHLYNWDFKFLLSFERGIFGQSSLTCQLRNCFCILPKVLDSHCELSKQASFKMTQIKTQDKNKLGTDLSLVDFPTLLQFNIQHKSNFKFRQIFTIQGCFANSIFVNCWSWPKTKEELFLTNCKLELFDNSSGWQRLFLSLKVYFCLAFAQSLTL